MDCGTEKLRKTNKMSSKYTPPHMRTKKVEPSGISEEQLSKEEEFPSLVENTRIRIFGQTDGKSFATLASTWAKDADEQRVQDIAKQDDEKTLESIRKRRMAPLPQFHNVRRFVEADDEDEEEEEEKPKAPIDPDEQGWIEVVTKKKYRKPKTFEERMNRSNSPDESNKDETVWNGEDSETYWK